MVLFGIDMVIAKRAGFLATAAFFLPLTLGAQSYSPNAQQPAKAEQDIIVLDYSRDELFRHRQGEASRQQEESPQSNGGGLEKRAKSILDDIFKKEKKKKPFYKSKEFWAWQAGMNVSSARAIESKYKKAFRECDECKDEVKIPNLPIGRWERYAVNFSIDTGINLGSHWLRNRKNRFLRIMGRVLPSSRIAQTSTEAYINNRISDGYNKEIERQMALYGQQNQ